MRCRFSPAYDTTVRYAAIDWARNMKTLPRSLVLQRIRSPLFFFLAVTSTVCALNSFVAPLPQCSPVAHTLLGSALGLLLVFRTNAAYDRFWEARKSWSVVTSECRHLATLACTFMTPEQALPMLSLIAAFPVCLKNYLRGGSEAAQKRDARRLKSLLLPEEAASLFAITNQPLYVLARLRALGQASVAAGVTEKEREVMFRSVSILGDCVSACERIFNTPIPLPYSRHTSRFLVLYVSTLPIALVHVFGWATLPVMAVVVWALFGILEIGNLIEEPFTSSIGNTDKTLYVLPLTEGAHDPARRARDLVVPDAQQGVQRAHDPAEAVGVDGAAENFPRCARRPPRRRPRKRRRRRRPRRRRRRRRRPGGSGGGGGQGQGQGRRGGGQGQGGGKAKEGAVAPTGKAAAPLESAGAGGGQAYLLTTQVEARRDEGP